MTYEEAKCAYIRIKADMDRFGCGRNGKDIAVALEAIDRQIPKKPIAGHPRDYICGRCYQSVIGSGNYCWFCGQAIDWSEEEG